jgi:hypothetical protein
MHWDRMERPLYFVTRRCGWLLKLTVCNCIVIIYGLVMCADPVLVLFLDRLLWRDPNSSLRKAKRNGSVTRPYRMGSPRPGNHSWDVDVQLAEGDEIPGLEEVLYDTLKDAATIGDVLFDVLSALAYEHWLDFFEFLPPHSEPGVRHEATMLWQVTQSLEQNLDVARYLKRRGKDTGDSAYPDWQSLVDRIHRRVELSILAAPKVTVASGTKSTRGKNMTNGIVNRSLNAPVSDVLATRQPLDNDEANHRSLDRVTYLGGFLLPISVVSGILSMGDPFGPTSPQFWVFWVAAAASAAVCLLVIYLDQLASIEAWFEVAADDAVDTLFQPMNIVRNGSSAPVLETTTEPDGTITIQTVNGGTMAQPRVYASGKDEVVIDVPQFTDSNEVEVLANSPVNPTLLVQRRSDGSKPKAWRRRQLGWGGALKQCVGYYRWKGSPNVQFSPPGLDPFRVKTV